MIKGRYLIGIMSSLGALAIGCSASQAEQNQVVDPVDQAIAQLGTAVDGCNNASAASATPVYGYDSKSKVLTLDLTNAASLVISAPSTKITVNGYACNSGATALTTANVTKIAINAAAGQDNRVIVDTLSGGFGTIFSATGGVTIAMADGNDTFTVRGGKNADKFSFVKSSTLTDVYAELTGDKVADVKVTFTGTLALAASMGDGNDTFNGAPLPADINAFGSSALVSAPSALGVTVYGGAGADTIKGGLGNDTLYGGDGDDTFTMSAATDGADKYYGDVGVDTVDYSNRGATVTVDIGPATAEQTGTANLSALTLANLNTQTLVFNVDGGSDQTVTFTTPTSIQDIADQINAVLTNTATIGYKPDPRIVLTTTTSTSTSAVQVKSGTSLTNLGLTASTNTGNDADDGLASEGDDVRSTIENITGTAYDDVLIGSPARNVIKAGAGNDVIMGGASTAPTKAAEADALSGEDGDDTIYLPAVNKYAVVTGGNGTDLATFVYRTNAMNAKLDASATAGDSGENASLAADIENITGGDGNDTLTGSASSNVLRGGKGDDVLSGAAGDDTLVGGPGVDKLNGGDGTLDVADYTAAPAAITITLCVDSAHTTGDPSTCTAPGGQSDGETTPGADVVANVEWLQGSGFNDTLTGSNGPCIIDGNAGNDTITGGTDADQLWGGAGNDTISGLAGDDTIDGNAGVDVIDGGTGDGDICITDGSDTPAAVNCEL